MFDMKKLKYSDISLYHEIHTDCGIMEVSTRGVISFYHCEYDDGDEVKTLKEVTMIDSDSAQKLSLIFAEMVPRLIAEEDETRKRIRAHAKKREAEEKAKAKGKIGPKKKAKKKAKGKK